MILARTPFRISFFGGGTDYPDWYLKHGGQVLSTAINKYCYITVRKLPPFFEHKHRLVYSKIEAVKDIEQIKHPVIKAILNDQVKLNFGLEIHHDGDLPARAGLGTSSAFAVGLINALNALLGKSSSKKFLAEYAINIEQKLLKENVGSQDQVAAAYGGFNKIIFLKDGNFSVNPVIISNNRKKELLSNLLLFFTGITRNASDIAAEQIKNTRVNESALLQMHDMVDLALDVLESENKPISDFGELMYENWMLKNSLSKKITTSFINETISLAKKLGATGSKLLGAGGGGFILIFAPPEKHEKIKKGLKDLVYVPFAFDSIGSHLTFFE